jgi:single-stranded DNA-binding protein
MNSVCLVGRLTRDPTVRFEGESQTATFTVAIAEPSREGKPYTLYVPCACWGRSAEAASLLSAEDLVAVQGRLGWQKRPAKCGQDHSTLVVTVREVQVLQDTAALTGRP